jgi:hypothetical protein
MSEQVLKRVQRNTKQGDADQQIDAPMFQPTPESSTLHHAAMWIYVALRPRSAQSMTSAIRVWQTGRSISMLTLTIVLPSRCVPCHFRYF